VVDLRPLLLASTINYLDRQTLSNAAVRITNEFRLSQEQYGNLEFAFGWAFAAGSLVFGCLADRVPLRWLYPAVLALWSLVGAGALGLFPCYHALTQELTPLHQGKVTGLAGVVAWAVGSPSHRFYGRLIDRTGSFDLGLAIAGGCLS
jgi:MFS family permease